jgi:outer membrane protein OmpA-like peptidoglycan-associated protein
MRLSKYLGAVCVLSIPAVAFGADPVSAPMAAPALPAPSASASVAPVVAPTPAPAPVAPAPAPVAPAAPVPVAPAPAASAPPPTAAASASIQLGGASGASAQVISPSDSNSGDGVWERYRPLPMAVELGVYGGLGLFSDQHNLQDLNLVPDNQYGHQRLAPALDLGLRAGFYPLSFLGVEGELGVMPTKTRTDGISATVWTYRAHVVAQYPGYRLVPFVLFGVGGMTLKSHPDTLGDDSDPEMHFGAGLKFAICEHLSARFDFRDNLMQKNLLATGVSNGDLVSNIELLLGASFTLGRTPYNPNATPAAIDSDGDGILDPQDLCPMQPGVAPNGCPAPVLVDTDRDGIPDASDPCPNEAEDGLPPNPNDGCPNKDPDGDGIPVPEDKCPTEKGVAPDGCPIKDRDGDGIPDAIDKCPDKPETFNGFEDADGCPDELPKALAKFAGVIKGIEFDFGKATIRKDSNKLLDEAVKVLTQYKDLHVLISGFTDDVGERQANLDLSEARAKSVKEYMVSKGIDAGRVETRGAGPDDSIADNKTEKGRQQNRRIEFKLVSK